MQGHRGLREGPAAPRPPPPGASLTPPNSPGPPQPLRPGFAHSPLPPLLGLSAALLPPFPGVLAPRVPGRGSFADLGTALARPQRRLVVGLGPAGPWRLLAAPGPVGPSPPFPGAAPCSAVVLSGCSSVPFPEVPVLRPRLWAAPLRFPPWSVCPGVPCRCPGLRVLQRLGRRWRGPAAVTPHPNPRGCAAPGASRTGAQHRPIPGATGRISAFSPPALRLA